MIWSIHNHQNRQQNPENEAHRSQKRSENKTENICPPIYIQKFQYFDRKKYTKNAANEINLNISTVSLT